MRTSYNKLNSIRALLPFLYSFSLILLPASASVGRSLIIATVSLLVHPLLLMVQIIPIKTIAMAKWGG